MLQYLGGRGLGAYLLLRERIYEVDPFSLMNPLIYASGPLTGVSGIGGGRYSVSARSPLTGTVFDGNSGGGFGESLRRLGLDYLIVTGACSEPSVLVMEAGSRVDGRWRARNDRAELLRPPADGLPATWVMPAGDLWGCEVGATLELIGKRFGPREAAVIGPAAERGVLFASIVTNHGRHIGRGGLGTVMASKRLKAIILDPGEGELSQPADRTRLDRAIKDAAEALRASPRTAQALPDYGTSVLVHVLNEAGAMPTRNYREGQFEHAEAISGEAMRHGFVEGRTPCRGCSIGCARRARAGGQSGKAPEYESLWSLGADCGVGDLQAIIEANFACNRAGLDAITMGATIACAMELSEEGLLPDGPQFGDAAAVIKLVEATARREGLGDELALGSARFAASHGRAELSMSVKGLEMPAYDPRGMTAQGLAYATSNRGACHSRANMLGPELLGVPHPTDRFATLGKADVLIRLQNLNAVLDSLEACKFTACVIMEEHYAQLLSAVLGEAIEPSELLAIGERIWTAERLFNLAAGFSRADDTLPRRILEEPVPTGPSAGHVVDLTPMLDEYYLARGWDINGSPRSGKLTELDLEWAAVESHTPATVVNAARLACLDEPAPLRGGTS